MVGFPIGFLDRALARLQTGEETMLADFVFAPDKGITRFGGIIEALLAIIQAGLIGIKNLVARVIDHEHRGFDIIEKLSKKLGLGGTVQKSGKENRPPLEITDIAVDRMEPNETEVLMADPVIEHFVLPGLENRLKCLFDERDIVRQHEIASLFGQLVVFGFAEATARRPVGRIIKSLSGPPSCKPIKGEASGVFLNQSVDRLTGDSYAREWKKNLWRDAFP
jgi:hypothetical protein